ncbi:methyltransferase domain-containing protein [Nitrososphaera sp.]|uniref:class I SAM-dependent methyltransferase n=1 Tax=Nitrososphaera sp. TaxID=1971748 RepID=UPI0017AB4A8B|nr:methyltransferase domain-containing protein [Nitrososphaera sp.]NWG37357.1 methyltransferase domain-containing protein [Nitrososphaera sp.]
MANFPERMLSILNDGMLCLMTSIGHRTGLFDAMSRMEPATSQEIAKAAKLNERYVREWLGGMVTGRIVEYDAATGKYRLPPEHAAVLTRAAGIDNLSMLAQYIALMGNVEDRIVECFRRGGGVPYSAYPKFQELQAEETARVFDARLVDQILPLTGMADRLREGVDVLDVGCGGGHGINLMARAFPKSRFYGYDISRDGIAAARAEAKKMKLANAHFKIADAAKLEDKSRFDLITAFDTIHDQAKPAKVLKGISRALRKDGVFLMADIAASSNLHENMENPLAPTLYTISTMHCMTVSLAYGGDGLGTVWGRQKALEMLSQAGFGNVEIKNIDGDIFNHYYIARK